VNGSPSLTQPSQLLRCHIQCNTRQVCNNCSWLQKLPYNNGAGWRASLARLKLKMVITTRRMANRLANSNHYTCNYQNYYCYFWHKVQEYINKIVWIFITSDSSYLKYHSIFSIPDFTKLHLLVSFLHPKCVSSSLPSINITPIFIWWDVVFTEESLKINVLVMGTLFSNFENVSSLNVALLNSKMRPWQYGAKY
jgi:hypothetical protein